MWSRGHLKWTWPSQRQWCGRRTYRSTLRESRAVWAGAQLCKTHFRVRGQVLLELSTSRELQKLRGYQKLPKSRRRGYDININEYQFLFGFSHTPYPHLETQNLSETTFKSLMSEFSEGRGLWFTENCGTHSVRKTDRLSKGSKKVIQYIQFLLFCQALLYDALAFGRTGSLYFPGEKKYPFLKHSCQSKTQFKLQYKTQALFFFASQSECVGRLCRLCVKSRTVVKARVLTSKHFCVTSNLARPYSCCALLRVA